MKKLIPFLLIVFSCNSLLAQVSISTHPDDAGACPNEAIDFSVTTVGATTFQWQITPPEGAGGWSDLNEESYPATGTATENLTYTVSGDMDGFKFRCLVSDGGTTITSNEAILSISQPAVILEHPSLSTICVGTAETEFSVTVESGSFTYQWQRYVRGEYEDDTSNDEYYEDLSNESEYYSNVTTPTLTVTNPDAEMDVSYPILRCVVTNGSCDLPSAHAPLYLYSSGPIAIDTQPDGYSCLDKEDNIMLSITTNLDYQPGLPYYWQIKDGENYINLADDEHYKNTNTKDLSILSVQAAHQGTYRCVVGDCDDAPISDEATVQFTPGLPQPELVDVTGECSINIPTAPTITSECFGGTLTGVADLKGPITEAGTHTLTWTFTDSNEDEHKFTQKLIVTECKDDVLAINTHELTIYPNPAKNFIHITLKNGVNTSVKILTMDGKTTRNMKFTNQHIAINTSDIAPGLYLLWIQNNNSEVLEKIIIQ